MCDRALIRNINLLYIYHFMSYNRINFVQKIFPKVGQSLNRRKYTKYHLIITIFFQKDIISTLIRCNYLLSDRIDSVDTAIDLKE